MRKISHHHFFIAILLTGGVFIAVLTLFQPFYNTDADIYFLYTLSGGYGNPPSGLLHYYLGMHPVLGGIISKLFSFFPWFNWYTFFLLLFHFISCVTLLIALLKSFRKSYAIGVFLIFFLFIESRLLLRFNFSGAALIGAISGSVSLLLYFKENFGGARAYRGRFFFFALLIFIAGLIRIHYMVLFGAFAIWMGLFFLPRIQLIKFLKVQLALGLFVFVCFQGQRYYFQQKITGWKQEEKIRKAYFYIHNHSHKEPALIDSGIEKLKQDLVGISFLYDKELTNYEVIKDFSKNNVRTFNLVPENYQSFYWLFMDLRVYLLLFAGVIVFLAMSRNLKALARFIYMSLFCVMVFLAICLFFKVTEVIFLAFLTSVFVSAILSLSGTFPQRLPMVAGIFILVLSCGWMITRIIKEDRRNKPGIANARMVIKELNRHPEILFVDAGTHFDFHISIWDTPGEYPIRNLIYNELLISNSYDQQLKRYGITDLMKEIPLKDNIYLVGEKASVLIEYYKLLYNQTVSVKKIPGFQYIDTYQIKVDNNK